MAAGRCGTRDLGGFRAGADATRTDCGRRGERPHAAARLSRRRQRSGPQGGGGRGLRSVRPRTCRASTTRRSPSPRSGTWAADKAFVDFQNDVTADDIALAEREGFRSVEHLKRYTTLGMATDQGKTLERQRPRASWRRCTGQAIPAGRHDELPAALRAGRHRRARRPSPRQALPADAADALASLGAASKARCSSRPAPGCARNIFRAPARRTGSRPSTREVATVRSAVGFCDVSTLGKIEVQGPDAGAFLDRLYINTFSNAAGRQGALWPDAARGRLRASTTARRRASPTTAIS